MPKIITDSTSEQSPVVENVTSETIVTDLTQDPEDPVSYSAEELSSPEAISVNVADETTPIIVLFGPPASGKTMTLVRLSRYLKSLGYTIEPIRAFRPSHDDNYKKICDGFNKAVSSEWAAELTKGLNFMLLKVSMRGKPICQILEAPGEHYFNPADESEPKKSFVGYISNIINSPNRKIWIDIVEPDWKDIGDREKYVGKISLLKSCISRKDKTVFLFNKIDKTEFVHGQGEVWMKPAGKYVSDNYPGIFIPFKNFSPISSLWRPYNCSFVPFVTGSYTPTEVKGESKVKYEAGPGAYPRRLWNEIIKML